VARGLFRLGKVKRRRPPVRIRSVDGRLRVEVKAPNDVWKKSRRLRPLSLRRSRPDHRRTKLTGGDAGRLLTVREVAERLAVSTATLYALVERRGDPTHPGLERDPDPP
jgi:hypothetical protein